MKETEKLDIILRGLYEYRGKGIWKTPRDFISDLTFADQFRLARWLVDQGYAIGTSSQDACMLKIDSNGVMYCEDESFSHPGNSITAITFIQNINSPDSNIQIGIQGQVLYPNILDIQHEIESLHIQLDSQSEITENMNSLIGECLDEISAKIDDRKPVPEFFWKWLGRAADGTSLIAAIDSLRHIIYP